MTTISDYDFDAPIERAGTGCEKYDQREKIFGSADVIPLWVADMDFAVAPPIQQAITKRAQHPVYGYSFASGKLLEALYSWYQNRHGWKINPARLMLTPGVVPSLFAVVNALTDPGDKILVPSPVYPPFFSAVKDNSRTLVTSQLVQAQGSYTLDFDDLQAKAKEAKLLMLCSPHNPVGRVWREDELKKLIDIALRYDLIVISDDIHCDLVYPGFKYVPLAKLAPPELRLLTAISPSKTFNIPGLNLSALVASHTQDKSKVETVFSRSHTNPFNPFSLAAFQAAYEDGAGWVDALMSYLNKNRDLVINELENINGVSCIAPQATCLMWLDCRALGMDDSALQDFFINKAGLGLNDGPRFGPGGSGFMRLNIGTQRPVLEQAISQLKNALEKI